MKLSLDGCLSTKEIRTPKINIFQVDENIQLYYNKSIS